MLSFCLCQLNIYAADFVDSFTYYIEIHTNISFYIQDVYKRQLVDFETGYRGWGVSFVVPAFICAGIVAVVVLVMCNRTNWAGYVLYQAVLAVFGLAMPVLYFTGLAHSLVGAVVPSILAVATLAGMAAVSYTHLYGERGL